MNCIRSAVVAKFYPALYKFGAFRAHPKKIQKGSRSSSKNGFVERKNAIAAFPRRSFQNGKQGVISKEFDRVAVT